jgi:hypothetical protein
MMNRNVPGTHQVKTGCGRKSMIWGEKYGEPTLELSDSGKAGKSVKRFCIHLSSASMSPVKACMQAIFAANPFGIAFDIGGASPIKSR